MPDAGNAAKETAAKLAQEALKKAAVAATTAAAPWVGIGCLIIAGLFLIIFLFSVLAILSLYGLCNYAPHTTNWISWWNNMGDICDYFPS